MHFNVYMNNFFSSIPLFGHLRGMSIGACGTVKAVPAQYPNDMRFRGDKSVKHEWNTIVKKAVGNVLVFFWMDNGPVQLLSTVHDVKGGQ